MGFPLSIKGDERIGNRWVKEKEVPKHILNRKADKRLGYVAELFEMAMGDKLTATKTDILKRILQCHGFRYLEFLKLSYSYENRLWAFSYNLDLSTAFDVSGNQSGPEDCRFIAKNKGKLSITDAEWIDGGSKCSEEEIDFYLKELNNRLIIDRIVALDMVKVVVTYNARAQKWSLSCRTLIGSTTWVMIPPIMQLIKPKPVECVKALEFFELVGSAVTSNSSKH